MNNMKLNVGEGFEYNTWTNDYGTEMEKFTLHRADGEIFTISKPLVRRSDVDLQEVAIGYFKTIRSIRV